MNTSAIERMSWEDKLRALEELWDAITREGDRCESPAWHEQELKQTQERHEAGAEESMDWADAKRELRK
jgi:Putative addiction module component